MFQLLVCSVRSLRGLFCTYEKTAVSTEYSEIVGLEEVEVFLPLARLPISEYTEYKPLGHLGHLTRCVTHSFMSSESFRQQMDSSLSAILLLYSPQRMYARGLTPIGVLLTVTRWEGQWAMIFLVTKASMRRLLGQRALICKTLLITAFGSLAPIATGSYLYLITISNEGQV